MTTASAYLALDDYLNYSYRRGDNLRLPTLPGLFLTVDNVLGQ